MDFGWPNDKTGQKMASGQLLFLLALLDVNIFYCRKDTCYSRRDFQMVGVFVDGGCDVLSIFTVVC